MSGHSHWAGIKHKKGITDAKRGKAFSKLVKAVTAAARVENNPDFNPRLRSAIEKARSFQVPLNTIERAITKAADTDEAQLEELIYEAYGPGGCALLMEIVTDNRNRTVAEVKKILGDHEGKWAQSGSVRWGFDPPTPDFPEWKSKFPTSISPGDRQKLDILIEALDDHDDVQKIYTNATI